MRDRAATFTPEAELQHLIDAVTDYAIMMIDPQGFLATWNPGAQRLKQWTAEEAIGRHFTMLYRREDLWKPPAELKRAIETGRSEDEGWRMRKDGSLFWASVIITPIWDEGLLRGFSKVVRDITERAKMEEELRQNVNALRDEKELRERFVMTLTHDLRSPLTIAKLTADAVLRAPERYDDRDERARHLQRVARSLVRADEMIQSLLDANMIESGRPLPITVDDCDLVAIAREVVDDASAVHPGRVVLEGDDSVRGFWNEGQIRRVIDNLVNNALKYGSVDAPIKVCVLGHPSRAQDVTITVNNRGPVIPADHLPKLFLPFHRVDDETTEQRKRGWGIGLTLVKGIAEAHGGHVLVESDATRGTTFTIVLPRTGAVDAIATGTR